MVAKPIQAFAVITPGNVIRIDNISMGRRAADELCTHLSKTGRGHHTANGAERRVAKIEIREIIEE